MLHQPIISAASVEASDLRIVGGKAYNLAKLVQAGFPCPETWVLTTASYQEFVYFNALESEIANNMARVDVTNAETLKQAADTVRHLFDIAIIPNDVARAIKKICLRFENASLAVRSSATSEDLPEFSFAGQHDSFIGIGGESAVILAIKKCWSSLWSARAIQYRAKAGVNNRTCRMAVILQPVVDSSAAGVLFSESPLSQYREAMVINAARGPGEQVVSGIVTPDTYVIRRKDHAIVTIMLGGTIPEPHICTPMELNLDARTYVGLVYARSSR